MSDLGHFDNHPFYHFDDIIVGDDIKWGKNQNAAGNWEAELGRGTGWFSAHGGSLAMVDQLANAAGYLYEMFCDDVTWAGQPEALLDFATFDSCRVAWDSMRLAPLFDRQNELSNQIRSILENYDGWLRRNGSKIELGYWKTGYTQSEIDALPIIGSNDLTSEPDVTPGGYEDCFTEVIVNYSDRDQYFHKVPSAPYKNPGLLKLIGEPRPALLDRPHITTGANASLYASNYGQRFGRPGITATIEVKLEAIEAIEDAAGGKPIFGQVVKVDSAALSLEIAYRVLACDYAADADGACLLKIESERAIWPAIFIQPPPGTIGNFKVDVPAIVNYKFVELPAGLKATTGIEIAILAQRPGRTVEGFKIHHSFDDVVFFEDNPPCTFAAYGKLTSSYSNSTADVDQAVGMQFELFGVDLVPPSDGHILDYTVLCFVGSEIMSVGKLFVLGGGIYKTWMYRGRYGTTKATHAVGAQCFFILRANIVPIANKTFAVGTTVYLKLQTFDEKQTFDINDFSSFSTVLGGGAVSVPNSIGLGSTFVITTEGKVDSRITATWTFVADQDIVSFNVRCRKFTFDATWVTLTADLSATQTFKGLEPNVLYEVQVQAITSTGQASDWSPVATITTAAPNVPGTPTGFAIIGGVQAATLKWTNATTGGIRGTQILFSEVSGDDAHLVVIDEVPVDQTSYTRQLPYAASFVFFAIRHVNTLSVNGTRTTAAAIDPVVEVAATKLPAPFIAKSDLESGSAGEADYRLQLVNTSAGQAADLEFSYNKTTWTLYSATGNYRDGISGSVLPTTNVGEISLSAGGQLFARQKQDGFLTSELADFYNNTSKTPHGDGTGGGDGTPGKNQP